MAKGIIFSWNGVVTFEMVRFYQIKNFCVQLSEFFLFLVTVWDQTPFFYISHGIPIQKKSSELWQLKEDDFRWFTQLSIFFAVSMAWRLVSIVAIGFLQPIIELGGHHHHLALLNTKVQTSKNNFNIWLIDIHDRAEFL